MMLNILSSTYILVVIDIQRQSYLAILIQNTKLSLKNVHACFFFNNPMLNAPSISSLRLR